jgi:hypothetical protein
MAILKGFPPSNTISPSVRIAEKDLSLVLNNPNNSRGAMVGFCSKGPINIPTLITSTRQLHTVFGYAHPDASDPYMIYAAEQYLAAANQLYIVRVANETPVSDERAELAFIEVPSAGKVIEIESSVPGPYTVANDSFFRFKVNGVLSSKTLVVPGRSENYSTIELVDELNDQIDSNNDGIIFYAKVVGANSYLSLKTVYAYGPNASLELVSVQDSLYGQNALIGSNGIVPVLGTGMTPAVVMGSVAGPYDFTGTPNPRLNIVLDGTDNVLIDNVVQTVNLNLSGSEVSTESVVDAINESLADLPGGFFARVGFSSEDSELSGNGVVVIETLHTGRDARIRVKPDSTVDYTLGLSNSTFTGSSPESLTGENSEEAGIVYGGENTNYQENTFIIRADSPGIEGNRTQVKIINDTSNNTFVMQVFNNGIQVESWGGLTKDPASRFYVGSYLSLVSDYIRVEDLSDTTSPPLNSNAFSPLDGVYTLSGGSDGIPSDPDEQDELIIGSDVGFTGLYSLSEPEQIDIDLIAVPGHSSTSVVTAMLNICQNVRMDCMAIVDPPFGLTVREITQWQNGVHPLNLTRFDSDFGALYWPWVKVRDTFNRIDVWVPPSGSVMATIASSDNVSAPWFAPAGINRGIVANITDVYQRPTLEERDLMYGNRNAINPIIQFVDVDGFVIFGQKTLQRRPTALDRVNVRRLMLAVEKRIRSASRSLIFEPNDQIFRERFVNIATGILREIVVGRGITDFRIQADEELNTPDVIDRNEFRARIGIQPTRAAEFIFLEFSIHRTGDFTSNVDSF